MRYIPANRPASTARALLGIIAIAVLATDYGLVAQETVAEAELPRYQVELLVFRNLDQAGTTAEIPRMPEAEIADILAQELSGTQPDSPLEPSDAAGDFEEIVEDYWMEAPTEQLRLTDIAGRLNRLQAYDLLLHLGWQQAAPDVAEAPELDFTLLGVDPQFVSGNAKLFSRRYLHLALDIELRERDGVQMFGSQTAVAAINDSRRIRLEELHYFDQPQLGIIAMVSRVEASSE